MDGKEREIPTELEVTSSISSTSDDVKLVVTSAQSTVNGSTISNENESATYSKSSSPRELDRNGPNIRAIEQCNIGYPYLAAFHSSHEEHMIFRRFGYLHTRLILQMQHELSEMESQLDRMDRRDQRKNPRLLQKRIYDEKNCPPDIHGLTRTQLLANIEQTLSKYDQLLVHAQQLPAMSRPTSREYRSVSTFITQRQPLVEKEASYIDHTLDIITLRPGRETAWLDHAVLSAVKRLPKGFVRIVFRKKFNDMLSNDENMYSFSRNRLVKTTNLIIFLWITSLIGVPIYALFYIGEKKTGLDEEKSKTLSMIILLISTMFFAAGLSLFTKAKRHEMLAASAAYCALLVVFVANLGVSNNNA